MYTCCPTINDELLAEADEGCMTNVDVCRGEDEGQLGGSVREGEPGATVIPLLICGGMARVGEPCQRGLIGVGDLCIMLDDCIIWGDNTRVGVLL